MENWFFQIEILIGLANFLLVAKKVKLTSGNVGLLWKYFQSYLTTALGGDKLYKAGFLCLLILFSICSHVQSDESSELEVTKKTKYGFVFYLSRFSSDACHSKSIS